MTDELLRKALNDLLRYVDRQTCTNEETHRGGAIWTICDGCGKKLADDEGGEAPTELERIIAEMRAKGAATPAYIEQWADRLAALAGAAPVAWMRRDVVYWGAEGRTDGERIMSERKVYDDDVPLYTHAPAKAREVTDSDVHIACTAYAEKMAELYGEGEAATIPMRAALATFAEGAE